ncbi:hypothetical protein B0H12DRAFT_1113157 [Mycena haematopus]|nr:hypothetical protein B0H12DRAFT_1113157 [Mycena haematopus]
MAGSMFFLRSLFTVTLLLIFVVPSSAQIVTGTLFGVAYPTAIVQTNLRGAYKFAGPVPWIVNEPQISIVGIDTTIGQTTFAYQDVYTEVGPNALIKATENGILVQNTAGLYFTEPATAARVPVVQSCAFKKAGGAVCEINNGGQGTSTIGGTMTPLFTFTATLPTAAKALTGSKAPAVSKAGSSSAPTQTQSTQASSHRVPVGAIVGATIGGVVLVGGALGALLFFRRRRRNSCPREKAELDSESAHGSAFSFADTGTNTAPTLVAFPNTQSPPETQRQRWRRLKQMQATVQQLQRNLSVASPGDDGAESQIAAQKQQIDRLLEEVERLRAIVARDEALPMYEE